eukprot:CAMPEP_0170648714 /NCGR_PEP_ID=MMETSP0224-20130122/44880_1 /TAXON_ID=285029 /ORGANISM="Togula jolla, Strain CCCM 725" /LENGTH=151 /DNA_ID=CAMNT_0010980255 /DNA_START=126 /DNA_END=581 /DNA_ORIENTATION=-
MPCTSRPGCTAHAVNVGLQPRRCGIVDDRVHLRDVDPPGNHVGADETPNLSLAKLPQQHDALTLREAGRELGDCPRMTELLRHLEDVLVSSFTLAIVGKLLLALGIWSWQEAGNLQQTGDTVRHVERGAEDDRAPAGTRHVPLELTTEHPA